MRIVHLKVPRADFRGVARWKIAYWKVGGDFVVIPESIIVACRLKLKPRYVLRDLSRSRGDYLLTSLVKLLKSDVTAIVSPYVILEICFCLSDLR